MRTCGQILQEYMQKRNMSITDIAMELKVSYQAVSHWLKDENIPCTKYRHILSIILDIDYEDRKYLSSRPMNDYEAVSNVCAELNAERFIGML